jgi:recombination protein RecR
VQSKIGRCEACGSLAEGPRCAICDNPRRDRTRICVVEQPRDVIHIESSGGYNGLYHVLGGLLAPMEGEGPEKLDLERLASRLAGGEVKEVILALSATAEGDGTALYVADRLKGSGPSTGSPSTGSGQAGQAVRVTRIARGLATGSSLDYANQGMLADALRGRQVLEQDRSESNE